MLAEMAQPNATVDNGCSGSLLLLLLPQSSATMLYA